MPIKSKGVDAVARWVGATAMVVLMATTPAQTWGAAGPDSPSAEPSAKPAETPAEKLAKAQKLFEELYAADYENALKSRDALERMAMVNRLVDGARIAASAPFTASILVDKAAELAASSSDVESLSLAVQLWQRAVPDGISWAGRLEKAAEVQTRLVRLEKPTNRAEASRRLFEVQSQWVKALTDENRFEDAEAAVAKAKLTTRANGLGNDLLGEWTAWETRLAALRRQQRELDTARSILASAASDPKANLTLAMYYLVDQNRPDEAAEYLKKAGGEATKLGELLADETPDNYALAESYKAFADKAPVDRQGELYLRAAEAYRAVLEATPDHPSALKIRLLLEGLDKKVATLLPSGSKSSAMGHVAGGTGRWAWHAAADFAVTNKTRLEVVGRESLGRQAQANVHAVSPSGHWMLVQENRTLALVESTTRQRRPLLLKDIENTHQLSGEFSPDGRRVVVTTGAKPLGGRAMICDVPSGRLLSTVDKVGPVTFSADSRSLLVSRDKQLVALDATSGIEKARLAMAVDAAPVTIAASPCGQLVAIGHLSGQLTVLNLATGKEISTQSLDQLGKNAKTPTNLTFSDNGSMLAIMRRDANLTLWDMSKNPPRVILGAGNPSMPMNFSADHKYLATFSGHRHVKVWNVAEGTLKADIELRDRASPTLLSFTNNGQALTLWNNDGSVNAMDLKVAVSSADAKMPPKKKN